MARAAGFQVIDLGVDVSCAKFENEIIRLKPDIVAMSSVLFTSLENMSVIVKHLEECNLRDNIKILAGVSIRQPNYKISAK